MCTFPGVSLFFYLTSSPWSWRFRYEDGNVITTKWGSIVTRKLDGRGNAKWFNSIMCLYLPGCHKAETFRSEYATNIRTTTSHYHIYLGMFESLSRAAVSVRKRHRRFPFSFYRLTRLLTWIKLLNGFNLVLPSSSVGKIKKCDRI